MALRPIRIWPDPGLSALAKPVARVDDDTRRLLTDMFDTMYDSKGVGLAANQVGANNRVIVIDLDPKENAKRKDEVRAELISWGYSGPVGLVNPQIIEAEGSIVWDEGCISVPGVVDRVRRKERVVVKGLDRKGHEVTLRASGLFAVCLQHEIDHLNGKVFVEYLSKLKRDVIRRKMQHLKSQGEDAILAAR